MEESQVNENFLLQDMFDQFYESEIMDTNTYQLIYDFISLENFRYGEYEGNEYTIRKINPNHIQLENHVATENADLPIVQSYTKGKFLALLQSRKNDME